MNPTLKDSEIIFFKKYKKYKSLLKAGQIVIFNHPFKDLSLVKRIKSVSKNGIEVSGDNLYFSDDSNKFGFISKEKVIGIVTSKLLLRMKLKNLLTQK